jgi:Mg2+ and Co2+ transporter CorA
MVPIRKGVLSVFMMKDGTLISLCAHEIHEALEPIYERLEDEHSLLRRSGDVSMLAHALLDVTVDLAVEITQAFEEEILNAESKVLVQAQVSCVRSHV